MTEALPHEWSSVAVVQVASAARTQQFPPQVWLAICAFGNIFGLLAYLRFGRGESR
ncbi:PLDc N-terminal domain-containing protein [Streptomyces mirabilis]|uniref:PLDc N-terminal domain-containing protein n=1 Tax=Streptomyces mirabilis TaxID=68239 RepID=UPI003666418C